jgi:hypothetical protein
LPEKFASHPQSPDGPSEVGRDQAEKSFEMGRDFTPARELLPRGDVAANWRQEIMPISCPSIDPA